MYRELLIGCGHARDKRFEFSAAEAARVGVCPIPTEWQNLTTLDHNADVKPDIIWDLNETPWVHALGTPRSPFTDSSFDEIHAYEVLEHLGQQGDAASFFAHFSEIWRLLKPGGYLCATVPSLKSPWLWGDPSHRRAISRESLVFLDQSEYTNQVDGGKSPMTDFRNLYTGDFRLVYAEDDETTLRFVLQAVKPARSGK